MSYPMISRTFLFLVTAFFLSGCAGHNAGGPPPSVQQDQIAPSESSPRNVGPNQVAPDPGMIPLLIRTKANVTAAQGNSLFNKLGLRVVQQYPSQDGILWALDAPKTARDESAWIAMMQKQTEVQTAEIDLTRKLAIPVE